MMAEYARAWCVYHTVPYLYLLTNLCTLHSVNEKEDVVEYLIEKGANLDAQDAVCGHGRTGFSRFALIPPPNPAAAWWDRAQLCRCLRERRHCQAANQGRGGG